MPIFIKIRGFSWLYVRIVSFVLFSLSTSHTKLRQRRRDFSTKFVQNIFLSTFFLHGPEGLAGWLAAGWLVAGLQAKTNEGRPTTAFVVFTSSLQGIKNFFFFPHFVVKRLGLI